MLLVLSNVFGSCCEIVLFVGSQLFQFFWKKGLLFVCQGWLVIALFITTAIINRAGKLFLPDLTFRYKFSLRGWKTISKALNLRFWFNNLSLINGMTFGHSDNLSDHAGFNLFVSGWKIEFVDDWARVVVETWDLLGLLSRFLFLDRFRNDQGRLNRIFDDAAHAFFIDALFDDIVYL